MIHVTRAYLKELHTAADVVFALAEGISIEELSAKSKLGVQTLYNLRSHRTRLPQFRTIVQLADAVGCHVRVERRTIRMGLATKKLKQA